MYGAYPLFLRALQKSLHTRLRNDSSGILLPHTTQNFTVFSIVASFLSCKSFKMFYVFLTSYVSQYKTAFDGCQYILRKFFKNFSCILSKSVVKYNQKVLSGKEFLL